MESHLAVLLATGFAIGIIILAALKAGGWLTRSSHHRELEVLKEFAAELEGNLRVKAGALEGTLMTGTYLGKKVTVQVGRCGPGSYTVQFGVEIDSTIDLTIQRPSFLGRVRNVLSSDGVQGVDTGYLVTSGDKANTRDVFVHGRDELIGLLEELMESVALDAIVAQGGWLYLECQLEGIEPRWFRWYFNRMLKVARYYERHPIRVREADRFMWTGGGTQPRCPFCREQLSEDHPDLVSCDSCRTLHHGECFAEHGGCTIYGCTGRQSEMHRA